MELKMLAGPQSVRLLDLELHFLTDSTRIKHWTDAENNREEFEAQEYANRTILLLRLQRLSSKIADDMPIISVQQQLAIIASAAQYHQLDSTDPWSQALSKLLDSPGTEHIYKGDNSRPEALAAFFIRGGDAVLIEIVLSGPTGNQASFLQECKDWFRVEFHA